MATLDLFGTVDVLKPEFQKYERIFKETGEDFEEACKILNDPDFISKNGWKQDTQSLNAVVHYKPFSFGPLFALTAVFDAPINVVFDALITDFEKMQDWNSNIIESKLMFNLSEHVDIIYAIGDCIYFGGKSVEIDEIKERKDRVRAKVNCGGARMTPLEDGKTKVEYLMSMDLRGFIPKTIINAFIGKLIVKDYEETEKYIKSIVFDQ
uniref:START domain-containing protein n=1 Tax=Panagrolaimus sp. JU765 TaxID=591449 RepID=A0AC34QZZ2_9BILA